MKQNITVTLTSLLSILLITLHLAGDVVLGFEKGGVSYLIVVPILVIWLYGTVVLAGRRSGYVIIILGSLLGMLVPWVHFRAPGGVLGGETAKASGALLFVWALLALGVTAMFSFILSARELWRLRRGPLNTSQ